jgi:hypothetical protein
MNLFLLHMYRKASVQYVKTMPIFIVLTAVVMSGYALTIGEYIKKIMNYLHEYTYDLINWNNVRCIINILLVVLNKSNVKILLLEKWLTFVLSQFLYNYSIKFISEYLGFIAQRLSLFYKSYRVKLNSQKKKKLIVSE